MSPDDLIAAFAELAEDDPYLRIGRANIGNLDEIRLVGWREEQTKDKFEALSSDAVNLFGPAGDDDEVTHWLWLVRKQAPELVEPDQHCLGYDAIFHGQPVEMIVETIPHAASASALAARRLRDSLERLRNRMNPAPLTSVEPATLACALERCPTLESALVYLLRQDDKEPATMALKWVHGQCSWQSRRNGAELWDYIDQRSRDEIVDPAVRELVVPELRRLDTSEHRRAFWSELLSRFPHVATTLLDESRSDGQTKAPERFTPTPADHNILQALAEATTTLIQVEIEQASGEPIRSVKERLSRLEAVGFVNRPHGKRKGYAITRAGRNALGEPSVR